MASSCRMRVAATGQVHVASSQLHDGGLLANSYPLTLMHDSPGGPHAYILGLPRSKCAPTSQSTRRRHHAWSHRGGPLHRSIISGAVTGSSGESGCWNGPCAFGRGYCVDGRDGLTVATMVVVAAARDREREACVPSVAARAPDEWSVAHDSR